MAKPLYTAEFSNGQSIKRRTDRTYTHAWMVCGVARSPQLADRPFTVSGFSRTEALAQAQVRGFDRHPNVNFHEVVAVKGGAL